MKRKMVLMLGLLAMVFAFSSCRIARGGGDVWDRSIRHLELHLYTPFKQLDALHDEIDVFLFKMDPEDPSIYP